MTTMIPTSFLDSANINPEYLSSLPIITHGSDNSLDHDIYVLCPLPIQAKDAKPFNDFFTKQGYNSNPIVIENNKVIWNLKGTNDEVHNSIYHTYSLHKQTTANPILEPVNRIHGLKGLRTMRGLLSTCSRTQYRDIIKPALSTSDLHEKIVVLQQIDLSQINDFGKSSLVETGKFFAFQIGQTLSLLCDNEDLFTKKAVAQKYPELSNLLNRDENADLSVLVPFYDKLIAQCSSHFSFNNGVAYYKNEFTQQNEEIEIVKEKVLSLSPFSTNISTPKLK